MSLGASEASRRIPRSLVGGSWNGDLPTLGRPFDCSASEAAGSIQGEVSTAEMIRIIDSFEHHDIVRQTLLVLADQAFDRSVPSRFSPAFNCNVSASLRLCVESTATRSSPHGTRRRPAAPPSPRRRQPRVNCGDPNGYHVSHCDILAERVVSSHPVRAAHGGRPWRGNLAFSFLSRPITSTVALRAASSSSRITPTRNCSSKR